jgi:hypothetical protein
VVGSSVVIFGISGIVEDASEAIHSTSQKEYNKTGDQEYQDGFLG